MSSKIAERPLLDVPIEHTTTTRIRDLGEYAAFYALRCLPVDWVSDFGSYLARLNIKRNMPHVADNARANLKILCPDWDDERIEKAVLDFQDNAGRVWSEFATLHRLYGQGRLTISPQFEENLRTAKDEPTLMMTVHTGNWEVYPAAFQAMGIDFFTFAIAPETWAQRVIVSKVREQFDITILPPDRRGLHRAKARLLAGGRVAIFPDEARHGQSMAPLFGRKPHRKGNLALAVWLAEQTGARIMLGNCRREGKARFYLDSVPYFHLPKTTLTGQERTLEAVAFLNEQVEPLVRDNLNQWYFLDDSLDEIT